MPDRQTVEVPKFDKMRAAVLNALVSGIPIEAQKQILNPTSIPQQVGNSLMATGQIPAGLLNQAVSPVLQGGKNFVQNLIQKQSSAAPPASSIPQSIPGVPYNQSFPISASGQRPTQDFAEKPIEPTGKETQQDEKRSKFIATLLKLGVPLGAAIAGTVNPNILPQAAGLSQGFTGEVLRQEDINRKTEGMKDFIVVDPETGKQKVFTVPKGATVQQERKSDDPFAWLKPGLEVPDVKTGEATKKATERIRVLNLKTNEKGTILSDEFDPNIYKKL